jgi:activator of HSP90 ATPase
MEQRAMLTALQESRSRRRFIAGAATFVGTLLRGFSLFGEPRLQSPQNVPAKNENSHRTTLHQEITIKTPPERIYGILLDSKKFATVTGAPATIDSNAGGSFSMFGGLIVGRNIELVPSQLIVQAWRPTHWSTGVYSIVKLVLEHQGSATLVTLDHTGFPEGEFDHLEWGWNHHYWEPLKLFVAS